MDKRNYLVRNRRRYFEKIEGPDSLIAVAKRRVRFEEVDFLKIVWHGHYVSYLEDGRRAFGDKYGLSYSQFIESGTPAPIVQLHLDYLNPLRFDEEFTVQAILHWTDALRLNFEYLITGSDDTLAARGYSVQLLMEPDGGLLLRPPGWLVQFKEDWQGGRLK
jgi:acyl-CoA thioester hydrolase